MLGYLLRFYLQRRSVLYLRAAHLASGFPPHMDGRQSECCRTIDHAFHIRNKIIILRTFLEVALHFASRTATWRRHHDPAPFRRRQIRNRQRQAIHNQGASSSLQQGLHWLVTPLKTYSRMNVPSMPSGPKRLCASPTSNPTPLPNPATIGGTPDGRLQWHVGGLVWRIMGASLELLWPSRFWVLVLEFDLVRFTSLHGPWQSGRLDRE
jgi:hypothetical protein